MFKNKSVFELTMYFIATLLPFAIFVTVLDPKYVDYANYFLSFYHGLWWFLFVLIFLGYVVTRIKLDKSTAERLEFLDSQKDVLNPGIISTFFKLLTPIEVIGCILVAKDNPLAIKLIMMALMSELYRSNLKDIKASLKRENVRV